MCIRDRQYAMFNEWLKQLYGESEGKEKKGLFPTSVTFSTDLHSLGQFIKVMILSLIHISSWFGFSTKSVVSNKIGDPS